MASKAIHQTLIELTGRDNATPVIKKSLQEMERYNSKTMGFHKNLSSSYSKVAAHAKQSFSGINNANARLAKSTANNSKRLNTFSKKSHQSNQTLGKLTHSLREANTAFGMLSGAALAGGVAVGVTFVRGMAKTAMQIDSFKNAMLATTGSFELADIEYDKAIARSKQLGASLQVVTSTYGKYAIAASQAGVSHSNIEKTYNSLISASVAFGLSQENTKLALKAVEQMFSKGQVQAEELRGQLGEQLPGAFQLSAKAMGVTTAELGAMLKRGEVVASELLPKLAMELDSFTTSAKNAASIQLRASLNRLNTSWVELNSVILESTNAYGGMQSLVESLTGRMSSLAKSIASNEKFLENLENKFKQFAKAKEYVAEMTGEVKGLEAAISVISGFAVFKVFGWAIKGLKHLKKIYAVFEKITGSASKLKLAEAKFSGLSSATSLTAKKVSSLNDKYRLLAKDGLSSATGSTKAFMGKIADLAPLLAGAGIAYETYTSLTSTLADELKDKMEELERHQYRAITRWSLPSYQEKNKQLLLEIKLLKERKALVDDKADNEQRKKSNEALSGLGMVAKPKPMVFEVNQDESWQDATTLWDKQVADEELEEFNAWADEMLSQVANQQGVLKALEQQHKADQEQALKDDKMVLDKKNAMLKVAAEEDKKMKALFDDHELITQGHDKQIERERELKQKSLEGWRNYFETLQSYEVKAYDQKNAMNMKTLEEEKALRERMKEIKKKETIFGIQQGEKSLAGASSALKGQADLQNTSSKKGFENWKKIAVAEAMITSISSAMNAFKSLSSIPFVGVPLGIAAASTVSMTTAQQIGQIQAQTFTPSARGGYDIPQGVNPLTQLHEREMVLPSEQAEVIRQLSLEKNKGKNEEESASQFNFNISSVGGDDFMQQLLENRSLIKAIVQ